MLIYNYKSIRPCVGIVSKIDYDRFDHANNVFVQWQTHRPDTYNDGYGLSGLNIHNMRHEFKVIREGVEIW
jgi:hypothetical protein